MLDFLTSTCTASLVLVVQSSSCTKVRREEEQKKGCQVVAGEYDKYKRALLFGNSLGHAHWYMYAAQLVSMHMIYKVLVQSLPDVHLRKLQAPPSTSPSLWPSRFLARRRCCRPNSNSSHSRWRRARPRQQDCQPVLRNQPRNRRPSTSTS